MSRRVVVVGGGFGGMASALRARARGYDVTLVDKLGMLGGRGTTYHRNGFVFDAGPTVITAPFLIEELFALFGRRAADYVDIRPIYPWYRIRFHDGREFNYGGTLEQMLDEIRKFEPADVDGYLKLLERTQRIFEIGFEKLGDQPFHRLSTMLGIIPHLFTLSSWVTVHQLVARYIRNEQLRKICSFHPLLVGGNPFTATCIYTLIHYLERRWGVHFAMGGTGALVAALGRLMREVGVDVQLGREVAEITVEGRQARGVRLADGASLPAEIVVCNGDAPYAYKHLIRPEHRRKWTDRAVERMRYSMGLFVLYFGATRTYTDLAHHTILLGERYRELLEDIFRRKILTDDFSLYLHAPTRTDPSMAPSGCETFYVLAPVPNLQGKVDWAEAGPRYRDRIVDYLDATVCPQLRSHIVEDFYVTPEHFRNNLNTLHGTGFSIEPIFQQSAYFRFHNKSEDVRNLYFVGAGTHPGAGMPGVLTSAKVLDRLLDERERTSRGLRAPSTPIAPAASAETWSPRAVMARHARTFYWASRLMPAAQRRDIESLYAFCRYIDDTADESDSPDATSAALTKIEEDLMHGASDLPPVREFLAVARRRRIDVDCGILLVRGAASDRGAVRIADEGELLRYSYRVASTVGLMFSAIVDVHGRNALAHAIDLGLAMQLTNIARDVVEDFHRDRIYLPRTWIDPERVAVAITTRDAAARRETRAAIVRLVRLAGTYYRSADAGMRYLPGWSRWAALTASRAYEAIGERVLRRGEEFWDSRTSIGAAAKLLHTLGAAWRVVADVRYRDISRAPRHQAVLHAALAGLPHANTA